MDENKIRAIVKDEMRRSDSSSRFNFRSIPFHIHDGKGSEQIQENDIIPSTSIVGNVKMATEGATYTIGLNSSFTPQNIMVYGTVTGTYSGSEIRAMVIGSAQLTPSFYLQPVTNRIVQPNNIQYPLPTPQPDGSRPSVPAQSGTYFLVSRGSVANTFSLSSEDHIVSVEGFPSSSDIYLRLTVVGFSKDSIQVYMPTCASGWTVLLTFVIS